MSKKTRKNARNLELRSYSTLCDLTRKVGHQTLSQKARLTPLDFIEAVLVIFFDKQDDKDVNFHYVSTTMLRCVWFGGHSMST